MAIPLQAKKVKPLMTIYPMANVDPLLHAYTRLNRKRSICKFCPKYGEKRRKETLSGCVKCNKHLYCRLPQTVPC